MTKSYTTLRDARVAGAVDRGRYEVLTALQWLQRFNASVKGEG